MEHTEEADTHTEEVIEQPTAKPRKKITYTAEQLEKKRESMTKAREFRNISYKEEVKTLKKKLEEKETEEEAPEPEQEPEPVIITKKKLPPMPTPKSYGREQAHFQAVSPKQKIIYQEEDEEEEEEYEEIIVRRRPQKTIIPKQRQYIERPDLIDETYKEKLQKQLQEERRRQVMADLFDY